MLDMFHEGLASSTFYQRTKYGTEEGPLVVCKIESQNVAPLFAIRHKSVIFVVDISASMSNTLQHVKTSILAFRRVLFQDSSSPEAREWKTNIKIVTFSNEAKLLWDSSSTATFEEAISRMQVQDCTNMGAGIEMAYRLVDPSKVTWIVVLTDGVSNKGTHQTPEAFLRLASVAPPTSRLVTIGYGEDFDAGILNSIGDFTHLETPEKIPILMGALAHEVSTASMFNTMIENLKPVPNFAFGQASVGVLSNDRCFLAGFVPPKTQSFDLLSLRGLAITEDGIRERLLNFKSLVSTDIQVTEEITKAFYKAETAKIINILFDKPSKTKVDRAKNVVLGWTDPIAAEERERVLRIIRDLLKHGPEKTSNQAVFYASSATKQTSYILDEFSTPGASKSGKLASLLVSDIQDDNSTPPRKNIQRIIPDTPRKISRPSFFD